MSTAPDQPLLDAVAAVLRALERVGAPHMVIGGLAVIARGYVRHTDDADVTVWAPDANVPSLLASFEREDVVGRIPDVEGFARQSQVLLLVHRPSGVPTDVSLAWLPFEREAIRRAERIAIGGVEIPIATAQDLVVYKAVAWRDQDRVDIEKLLRMHWTSIDLDYIQQRIEEFSIAIDEPERLEAIRALLERIQRERKPVP